MSGSPFRFRRPSETRYLSSQQNLRESAALPEETPAQPQSRFTKGEAVSPPFYNPSLFVHQKDSETFILGTIYIYTYICEWWHQFWDIFGYGDCFSDNLTIILNQLKNDTKNKVGF